MYGLRFLLLTVGAFTIPGVQGASILPDVPRITGAFDVELRARFNSLVPGIYQNLFECRESTGQNRIIFLQNDDTTWFQIESSQGAQFCHFGGDALSTGQEYTYNFGINSTGFVYIYIDGVLQKECSPRRLPVDVQRDCYLGDGPTSSAFALSKVYGAVLGLQTLHHPIEENSISSRIKHLNLPGQAFQDGLEATFYARFDNIGSRSGQRVFEFGTGVGANLNWCGQVSNTTTMECGIVQDGIPYVVTANNAIEEGVFAFWKFEVGNSGTFRLEKDGSLLQETTHSITRTKMFRQLLSFGESAAAVNDDLEGAVVGFRLQRLDGS